jgi:ribosomal protein S18 acetylase RimI-like enzyme
VSLAYKTGTASLEQVLRHLECCDEWFVPSLSSRVNLDEYARKTHGNAVSFEAWDEDTGSLVGMINAYLNDPKGQTVYITNVSVVREYTGHGIASALLAICLARAQADGFSVVKLEVSPENVTAMRLYARAGFKAVADSGKGYLLMVRQISERGDEKEP